MLIWSAVFRLSVSKEARKRRVLSLSKRPTEVLELPTSMASSMGSAPFVPVLAHFLLYSSMSRAVLQERPKNVLAAIRLFWYNKSIKRRENAP